MIYFDNAATTYPKPKAVIEAVKNSMEKYGANPGRSGHTMSIRTSEKIFECRQKLLKFFNADDKEVIFCNNCTEAINIAIKGVLNQGDHVIISDLEHNSILKPIHSLAEKNIITYSVAEVVEGDFDKTTNNFAKLINENTRMIACTHASNLTGIVLPIEQIGSLCKEKNILFLVDSAQSAGVLNIDMKEYNIDFLCMPGHKGLYGPMGTGTLITGKGDLIRPLIEGGTGSLSLEYNQPDFLPDKLESGTLNSIGIIGLSSGLDFLNANMRNMYIDELLLAQQVYDGLNKIEPIILYTKRPKYNYHVPVVCFNIENRTSEEVAEKLNEHDFAVRGGYQCTLLSHQKLNTNSIGAVRVSFSIFNTQKEVSKFLNTIVRLFNK